jgi:membrane protein required for colicin V production
MHFTMVDTVVVGVLFVSVLVSIIRGITKEILSLVAWIAAFYVAAQFCADVAEWLPQSVHGAVLRIAIGFVLLLLAVRLLGTLVNWALDAMIRAAGLKLADRGLGGLFGFLRGCVIVLCMAVVAGLTDLPRRAEWRQAMTTPWVELAMQSVKPLLSEEVAAYIRF